MKIRIEYTVEDDVETFRLVAHDYYGLPMDAPIGEVREAIQNLCRMNGESGMEF